jgi:hypothetical protein
MRKSKKKTEDQIFKSEQTPEREVSLPVESTQTTETPAALTEDVPVAAAPAAKHRGRKARFEKAEAEQFAPKRTRKTKVAKMAAELAPRKHKGKEKTAIPETAEEAVVIQYAGQELDVAELRERVITAYVEAGHRRGRISKLNLYIKPEDQKVYYVINDKISGSIDF